ncbi:30S ribosomal protein S8 [Candidatus Saccharibacteria bacterium]|nr:30S ribosomal protein S8 [Candidatus Saccharibacteria bacterium]
MSTTTTDPIADMLSRIRNAIAVNKNEVSLPHSKVKEAVAKLLKENNYIDTVDVEPAPVGKTLKLVINPPQSNARITEIKRLSTPGRRYYTKSDKIPTVMRGRGIVIVSTSKGMMTGLEAKKQGVGGELICKVY